MWQFVSVAQVRLLTIPTLPLNLIFAVPQVTLSVY